MFVDVVMGVDVGVGECGGVLACIAQALSR